MIIAVVAVAIAVGCGEAPPKGVAWNLPFLNSVSPKVTKNENDLDKIVIWTYRTDLSYQDSLGKVEQELHPDKSWGKSTGKNADTGKQFTMWYRSSPVAGVDRLSVLVTDGDSGRGSDFVDPKVKSTVEVSETYPKKKS